MRTSVLIVALAALLASAVVATEAAVDERDYAEAPNATPLDKRQAVGGGAGTATTATSLQSISGYTPPASSVIASPNVSSGSIVATNDIPGFNSSSSSSTSPADMLRQPLEVALAAAGGVAAGAAILLF